jgi:hypothetical protein
LKSCHPEEWRSRDEGSRLQCLWPAHEGRNRDPSLTLGMTVEPPRDDNWLSLRMTTAFKGSDPLDRCRTFQAAPISG